jgi:hypothetical protein
MYYLHLRSGSYPARPHPEKAVFPRRSVDAKWLPLRGSTRCWKRPAYTIQVYCDVPWCKHNNNKTNLGQVQIRCQRRYCCIRVTAHVGAGRARATSIFAEEVVRAHWVLWCSDCFCCGGLLFPTQKRYLEASEKHTSNTGMKQETQHTKQIYLIFAFLQNNCLFVNKKLLWEK